MALNYLADTSVLTRVVLPSVRKALSEMFGVSTVARCSMSDLELGFSARNSTEWDRIHKAAEVFTKVEVMADDFNRAGQVQRTLAAAGLKGRKIPDLLIAATAERAGLTLLHYDHDFEHIAEVTGQEHRWIVPPGSID